MPICEPYIHVECDKCGEVTDGFDLTPLAGGGWDDRNVKPKLKRWGWRVTGNETICTECVAIEAEKAEASSTVS